MNQNEVFTHIDADLVPVLQELRCREPIFHTPEFGTTMSEFETVMAPDYWEVGASGRRYSRKFILSNLEQNPPVDATLAEWEVYGFGLRRLGSDTYLLTYTLRQVHRLTRRATIWQKANSVWHILYHQGTIVTMEENDVEPSRSTLS